MSDDFSRTPLLGRLVEDGPVSGQGEVVATFGLTALLEDDAVGARFTDWLEERGRVALPDTLTYVPEAAVPSGRVDIAGIEDGTWQVICEAKFGEPLTAAQIDSYLADAPGARLLVLLVPEKRRGEAEALSSASYADRATLIVSWGEVCDALIECGANECDVAQLRSLCNVAARGLQRQGGATGVQARMAPVENRDGVYYVAPHGGHIIHSQEARDPCPVAGRDLRKLVDEDAQAIAKVMVGVPLRAKDGTPTRRGMFCMFCSARRLTDEELVYVDADREENREVWQQAAQEVAGRMALGLAPDGSEDEEAREALRQPEAGESDGGDEQGRRTNRRW